MPLQAALDELGGGVSAAALAAMEAHARLLMAWGAGINLTAHRTPAAIALEHIVDSLTALPLLAGSDELLDLGSGAGYPGLPLAWSLPVRRAALVESIGKKARFLEVAVSAGGRELTERGAAVTAIEVLALRAEDVARSPEHRERWAVVVARAVAPMADLVELALPLLRYGGRLVAWKRDDGSGSLAAELGGRFDRHRSGRWRASCRPPRRGGGPRRPRARGGRQASSHSRPSASATRRAPSPATLTGDARRGALRHPLQRGGARRGPRSARTVRRRLGAGRHRRLRPTTRRGRGAPP